MSSKNYNDIDKNSLLLGGGMGRGLLFPGSFDPFTKGHADLVERGLQLLALTSTSPDGFLFKNALMR